MLTRDQQRAQHAYASVQSIVDGHPELCKDYKIAVHSIGANILQSGLAAAIAWLERDKSTSAKARLLGHLAGACVAGIGDVEADSFAATVRSLDCRAYMLATRDLLQTIHWLRRATQALILPPSKPEADEETEADRAHA